MTTYNEFVQAKYDLITKDILPSDVLGKNYLLDKISNNKPLKGYFGTAPTGKIHIGYLVPLLKIGDMVNAGCNMIILLADVHAFLDSRKSNLEDEARTEYYKEIITETLRILNVDLSKITFMKGSNYQYSKPYIQDLLTVLNKITVKEAQHAGAEVVKQSDNPNLASLIYPIMQMLDETHLNDDIDLELGGIDQVKIFGFASDHRLDKTKKMTYVMNRMVSGLSKVSLRDPKTNELVQNKMSSSESAGKLDLLDTPKETLNKFKQTYCLEGDAEDNTIIILCKDIIFPLLTRLNLPFVIVRKPKFGGDYQINSCNDLVEQFSNKQLHPEDLKNSVAYMISKIFEPLRAHFMQTNMVDLLKKAYPN